MLQATALDYSYGGASVLQRVDLSVDSGEVVSLIGPNGSGKSTLLKCIGGMLSPAGGGVRLHGRLMTAYGRRELAREIAYVPQHAGPVIVMPVVDMIMLGRAPHRGGPWRGSRDRDVVMDVIQRLGLEPLAFRSFATLSGGERQRVLLARALAQEGRLLLLDEPTSALDLRHQLDTMAIVRSLVRDRSMAALVAIHDLGLAGRFSDRLVMLAKGRVHAHGAWTEVLTPGHIERVYGVGAVVGSHQGLPYVIPTRTLEPQS